MVELSRYNVSDEQAGLDQGVLKNKLGYTTQKDLDDAETILQADAYKHFFDLVQTRQFVFDVDLLMKIHRYFFETLYTWAGSVRAVDISKGEMLFAPAKYISSALKQLDQIIYNNLPTSSTTIEGTAKKLAVIHNEFNVVHPFRDGNGRTIRLFLDLLVHTLGFDPINYGDQGEYLKACVVGASQSNIPMQKIIKSGLVKRKS